MQENSDGDESDKHEEIKKKRGRKRIPNKWSRIVSVDDADVDDLEVWVITDDTEGLEALKATLIPRKKKEWTTLFISEGFFTPQDQPKLEDYALKDRKLRMLGQRVTTQR